MNQRVAEASPRGRARIAGAFYLVNIVSGALALLLRGRLGVASLLVATVCYLAVTFLFYGIFKPVNKSLSFAAALFSLAGCALWALGPFLSCPHPDQQPDILRSLLPADRISDFQIGLSASDSGALMALGGLGWMTFISPPLAHSLSPYNMLPGVLGELSLTRVAAGFRRERTTVEAAG